MSGFCNDQKKNHHGNHVRNSRMEMTTRKSRSDRRRKIVRQRSTSDFLPSEPLADGGEMMWECSMRPSRSQQHPSSARRRSPPLSCSTIGRLLIFRMNLAAHIPTDDSSVVRSRHRSESIPLFLLSTMLGYERLWSGPVSTAKSWLYSEKLGSSPAVCTKRALIFSVSLTLRVCLRILCESLVLVEDAVMMSASWMIERPTEAIIFRAVLRLKHGLCGS